ncbi:hypothetical protein B0H17DRAFT_1132358 [Mycena rosella]|uniref:HMG box domain-containing protein n=1 Tax=Mycena rosella TaxID=1033263 RepID=A0AAD7DJZ2_MYCRO|nr:hypothetical protein B0H17DRAFT_1132358 [Mycena rosella]
MPIVRNVSCRRRSRRFSTRTEGIISRDDDDWECAGELLYPDSDITSPSRAASPIVHTPPPPARTSHARQKPDDHIPRPPNPFIVFRSEYCVWNKQLDAAAVRDHRLVSKLAGQAWAALDGAARQKYVDLAHEKKLLHAIQYPGYTYAPRSGGKSKKRKASDDCDYEERVPQPKRRRSKGGARPLRVIVGVEASAPPSKRARVASSSRSSAPSPDYRRLQTPELSPNTSSDSEPVLYTPTPQLVCDDDDDFVPTAEIPPLDLCAVPSEKTTLSIDHTSPRQRPSLHVDGYQAPATLGFKAEIPKAARDERMWFNPDGTCNVPLAAPPPAPDSISTLWPINPEVQFTNPFQRTFASEFEDWIHTDRLD